MACDQPRRFYLFNSDKTYNLEIVKTFLLEVEEKYGFKISVDLLYFGNEGMANLCETILPNLVMDFAVFVVHANESRLSINEDNAGIGYARLYRALLEKTENKVLIVIGGDSYYKDEDEKARFVLSRWTKRKVASQFQEEYLDGRESFIFSWDKKHRPIHEEAIRHFLDPGKRGFRFKYTPPEPLSKPVAPAVAQPLPKPVAPAVAQPLPKPVAATVAQPFPNPTPAVVTQPLPKPRAPVDPRPDSAATDLRQEGREKRSRARHRKQAHKKKSKRDARKGSYGAISPGADETRTAHPESEPVLLKAYLYKGNISYTDEDVLHREPGWLPTEKQLSHLREFGESMPVAIVTFVKSDNGGVRYTVNKVKPSKKRKRIRNCTVL